MQFLLTEPLRGETRSIYRRQRRRLQPSREPHAGRLDIPDVLKKGHLEVLHEHVQEIAPIMKAKSMILKPDNV